MGKFEPITFELELGLIKDYYEEISSNLDELQDLVRDKDTVGLIEKYEEIKHEEWFDEVFIESGMDITISDYIEKQNIDKGEE